MVFQLLLFFWKEEEKWFFQASSLKEKSETPL